MVKTSNSSINYFSKDFVDLDSDQLALARRSRKWLVEQIEKFPSTVENFPTIYTKKNDVQMGSFSRRTKIRPIDDIDFMVVFSGQGATYSENSYTGIINIALTDKAITLNKFLNNFGGVCSIRLLNKLKSSLINVPQYSSADVRRNMEAVTLKLKSYDWNFDIVPAFLTSENSQGKSYYLIPDGYGNWKKTDPRIDAARTMEINQANDGKVLKFIRLIKYWNKRPTMPSISSYLLENMVLNYFENSFDKYVSEQWTLYEIFSYLQNAIYSSCPDPKGIQGDLNQLPIDIKLKVAQAANQAAICSQNAIDYSIDGKQKEAHLEWKKVFGLNFPDYA